MSRQRLHVERAGPERASVLFFVHPNPMDASSWTFQMAHLSTGFRTLAVDLPGYGHSPAWEGPFGLDDVAAACWREIATEETRPPVLVGCSIGAHVVMRMAHLEPGRAGGLVLSGTGHHPPGRPKGFAGRRAAELRHRGLAYRHAYFQEGFSESFRNGPIARWFEHLAEERGGGDLLTILSLLDAAGAADPEGLHAGLRLPVLIMGGSEDPSHERAGPLAELLPDVELVTITGAGHACHVERPDEFDRRLREFVERRVGTSRPSVPGEPLRGPRPDAP